MVRICLAFMLTAMLSISLSSYASPIRKAELKTREYKNRVPSYDALIRDVPTTAELGRKKVERNTWVKGLQSRALPSQAEYGRGLVDANVLRKTSDATQNGISPIELVKSRAIGAVIPAVINPKGELLVLDSHHGIWTNKLILKGIDFDPYLLAKVLGDFRGVDDATYIRAVFGPKSEGGMGKGQYSRAMKNEPLETKVASLPTRFDDMTNNPYRSLVGAALSRYGIDAEILVDYVEFRLINHMLDIDEMPAVDSDFSNINIDIIARALYQDPILTYLRSTLRNQKQKDAFENQLVDAVSRVKKLP